MTKVSKMLLFLICSILSVPSIRGQSIDCPLSSDIDLNGDGLLLLRQVINPSTSSVSVELEYVGLAWVAIAFSETLFMVPNTAIIGLPLELTVLKYDMTANDLSAIVAAPVDRQILTNDSIVQDDTSTILKFTRALEEAGETTVAPGNNTILVAYGLSNAFAHHVFRLATTVEITTCDAVDATPTSLPVMTPTSASPVEQPLAIPVAAPVTEPTTDVKEPAAAPMTELTTDVKEPAMAPAAPNMMAPANVPVNVTAPAPTSGGNTDSYILTTSMMLGCLVGPILSLTL